MSSDKLHNRAREAASRHDEAFSEDAWAKMEKLLDEHLPENGAIVPGKKTKRERWLFLLVGLVCGGMIAILFYQPTKDKLLQTAPGELRTNKTAQHTDKSAADKRSDGKIIELSGDDRKFTVTEKVAKHIKITVDNRSKIQGKIAAPTVTRHARENSFGINNPAATRENRPATFTTIVENAIPNLKEDLLLPGFAFYRINPGNGYTDPISIKSLTNIKKNYPSPEKTLLSKRHDASDKENKFSNAFSLSLSAGPDVSAVNWNEVGKLSFAYGIGVGYTFRRWQLRSGLYSADKRYHAVPGDYSPPTNFWAYYPHLEKIDANCRVQEIPVIISYHFKDNPRTSWFASAGISSLFMKKETYDYTSKNYSGQYYTKRYTIKNENQHYFSSLRFSTGYTKNMSRNLSLTAEPYIYAPISGVGYGKVKLRGGGMLFSLSFKPFTKK